MVPIVMLIFLPNLLSLMHQVPWGCWRTWPVRIRHSPSLEEAESKQRLNFDGVQPQQRSFLSGTKFLPLPSMRCHGTWLKGSFQHQGRKLCHRCHVFYTKGSTDSSANVAITHFSNPLLELSLPYQQESDCHPSELTRNPGAQPSENWSGFSTHVREFSQWPAPSQSSPQQWPSGPLWWAVPSVAMSSDATFNALLFGSHSWGSS
jgi:hypothetical protein